MLLEKQGRCSQKLRNTATGNLAQVTHTVGQNMTDISNIGNPMVRLIISSVSVFLFKKFLSLVTRQTGPENCYKHNAKFIEHNAKWNSATASERA